MVGVLPRTALLLTDYDHVVGHFTSYGDIARHIGIDVSDSGSITFMGKPVYPKYIMEDTGSVINNHWKSKSDVINDWAKYHMSKYMPSSYSIYRYLT